MRPPDRNRFNCAVAGCCALGLGALLLGGCASSRDGGTAGPSATDPAASTAEQADDDTPVDVAMVARRSGYQVVNQDGQTLYCRRETTTGSHVRQQTSCLTDAELRELQEATRRAIDDMTRQQPPKHGT